MKFPKLLISILLSFSLIWAKDSKELNRSLWMAAISGNLAKVKGLVKQGADVNAKDMMGSRLLSSLMVDAESKKDIIKYLIEKGADVNIKNSFGNTPLSMAVNQAKPKLVNFLLKKGADITIPDSFGKKTH